MHLDYLRPGNFIGMLHSEMKKYLKELGEKNLPYKTQAEIIGVFEVILGLKEMKTNKKMTATYLCSKNKESLFINGNSEIPRTPIETLQSKDSDELISQMTVNFSKIFESDTYFSKDKFCSKMLQELAKPQNNLCNYYENPLNLNFEFNQHILEEHYKDGNYDRFMAYLFYYLITRVSNKLEFRKELTNQLKLSDMLMDLTKTSIIREAYYDTYYRKVEVTPDLITGSLFIESCTVFTAKFLSPKNYPNAKWAIVRSFPTPEMRETFSITRLKINGVDYTKEIKRKDHTDISKNDYYFTKFFLEKKFSDNYFKVEITSQSSRNLFYSQFAYRLKAPCFDFRFDIQVKGEYSKLYAITFQMFSPHIHEEEPNRLLKQTYSNVASIHIPQLLPINSGFFYNIRLKPELIATHLNIEELLRFNVDE